MIVERQRADAVQDLVEEILGMDLLHDLPVDPIAHAQESIAVDPMNGGSTAASDPRSGVDPPDRTDAATTAIAPHAPPRRRTDPISMCALNRRMLVTDVARQHVEVPIGLLRQREEQVGFRTAGTDGDAAMVRCKKSRVSRSACRMRCGLADVSG